MNVQEFKTLHDALSQLKVRADSDSLMLRETSQGICGCIDDIYESDMHLSSEEVGLWIEDQVKLWPKIADSLVPSHPVEGDVIEFIRATRNRVAWEGEYGARRRELLDWLINRVAIAMMNL